MERRTKSVEEDNMKVLKLMALATAGVVFTAGSAAAQACMGVPIGNANFAVRGEVELPDGAKEYDAVLNANMLGPIAFELFGGIVDFEDSEETGATFGGKVGYELGLAGASVCPLVGADYTTVSDDADGVESSVNLLVVPIGIGVGTTLPVGTMGDIALYAQPAFLWMRSSVESTGGAIEIDESDSTNEFGAEAGAVLGIGRFLLGGSVNFTTLEDSDAVFALTAGVRFGS